MHHILACTKMCCGLAPLLPQAAIGGWHCLALSQSGQVYSWGGNEYQQCGVDDNARDIMHPQPCLPHLRVIQVACGGMNSVVLTESGEVWTWGEPWGDFALNVSRTPKKVRGTVMMTEVETW